MGRHLKGYCLHSEYHPNIDNTLYNLNFPLMLCISSTEKLLRDPLDPDVISGQSPYESNGAVTQKVDDQSKSWVSDAQVDIYNRFNRLSST
jgi:hypothetical protein